MEEKAIFYERAAERRKDKDYTEEERDKCKLIFEEAYRIQREKINICKHHKIIIKTILFRKLARNNKTQNPILPVISITIVVIQIHYYVL